MDDLPSRTAEFMALFRALESARPAHHRLFEDRLAKSFLSPSLRIVAALAKLPGFRTMVMEIIDRRWPGSRTSGIARTRVIDDLTIEALSRGTRQVVLLGAGFDSRPYRLPGMERAAIYEVDHPATSRRKQATIKKLLGSVPANVRFVPMDFNKDDLDTTLRRAGFRSSLSTFIIWEGVSNYLSPEAADGTLAWCGRSSRTGTVAFTYIDREVLANPRSFHGTARIANLLEGVGEQWTFGLNPSELGAYLIEKHLSLESDSDAAQYREKYFGNQSTGMKGYEFYHVAVASLGGQD
jgi:methyltransferase (TIGR00027 family)